MIKSLPTSDEINTLKAFDGSIKALGICEKFYLELMKIENPMIHLDLCLLKKTYESQMLDIEPPLYELSNVFKFFRHLSISSM